MSHIKAKTHFLQISLFMNFGHRIRAVMMKNWPVCIPSKPIQGGQVVRNHGNTFFGNFIKTFSYYFFFVEKSLPKLKVVLGHFLSSGQNSSFGAFFVFRTKQSFWGIFCRENSTVILEDFFQNLRPFLGLPKK